MTTIEAEGIIDAEVMTRAAVLRARVAATAKVQATRGKAAAKRGALAGVRRLGRGLAAFPADLVAYWGDVDGALDVTEAAPGDPTTKAKAEHETSKRRHRANVVGFVLGSLSWCSAGWTGASAWVDRDVLAGALLVVAASAAVALVLAAVGDLVLLLKTGGKAAGAGRAILAFALFAIVFGAGVWWHRDRFADPGVTAVVVAVLAPWLVSIVIIAVTSLGVWKGKHGGTGWLWPTRLGITLGVAALSLFLHLTTGLGPVRLTLIWVVPVLGWLTWAASDGEVFGDAQAEAPRQMLDEGPVTDGRFELAVNESVPKLDPKDPAKTAHVLPPGIVPSPNGKSYSVVVDTRGIVPAEALVVESARSALAAKLRVGVNAVFPVVHDDNAALATVTVLSPDAFGEPVTSALVTATSVDLWNPPPFMRVLTTGADIPLRIAGNNVGIGGMPDFGKSTTLNALILMFLLGGGKVKVIDGGEVDTEPFHKAGLLSAWCRDPKDAIDLLTASVKEIEETQSQLAEMNKRKVDPEFFAATGTNFELLAWDELEAYANHPDPKIRNEIRRLANDYISRCRKTGRMMAWATQSASAEGVDSNFRDKTIIRIGHYCSTPQMSDKILGSRKASRGVDASTLPKDVQGAAWYLGRTETDIVRPHRVTEEQVDQVIVRLVANQRANTFTTAADDDRVLADRVAGLIKAEGYTVGDRRVMLARDVALRLEVEQMALRAVLGRLGIGTQKVWRPDDEAATNRAHYVLTDFPAARAM